VVTATSNSDGRYFLPAPFTNNDDINRTYKIRFTYPDSTVVYFDNGAVPGTSSTSDWNSATVGGPSTWVNLSYTSYTGGTTPTPPTPPDPPSTPLATSVHGYANIGNSVTPGVTVDLVIAPDQEGAGTSVATTTTDSDGHYELDFPTGGETENTTQYVVQFTYPDGGPIVFADDQGNPRQSSTALASGGYLVGPTSNNDMTQDYNGYAYPAGLSQSDSYTWCEEGGVSAPTQSTNWIVCPNNPLVPEVETEHHNDGLDAFGVVEFATPDGEYQFAPDTTSTEDIPDGRVDTFTKSGAVIWAGGWATRTVDITVVRTIQGSYSKWEVSVTDSETHALVTDIPFTFTGNLGSDGSTQWFGEGDWRVSDDGLDNSDPVLAHHISTSPEGWTTSNGDDDPTVTVTGGQLTYIVAAIDYLPCASQNVVDAASAIAQNAVANFGENIDTITGTVCATWTAPTLDLRVGVPFDQTFFPDEGAGWNWDEGGNATLYGDVPDGLQWEVVNPSSMGQASGIRIYGTPTTAGPYEFTLDAWDSYGSEAAADVTGEVLDVVAPNPTDASLTLGINIGDDVDGAPVTATATGLQDGADYTIVLRSTPITLASGSAPVGGSLVSNMTIPAGLEAGWHSITLTSTWYTGVAFSKVVWFQVDANGKLVAISNTAPEDNRLAFTGSNGDPTGAVAVAGAVFVLGTVLVLTRRRKAKVERG
jgi:hypothetical protein